MKWILPEDEEANHDDLLSRDGSMPPLAARILRNRGFLKREDAENFLNSTLDKLTHPGSIGGIEKASTKVIESLQAGDKIAVYADFDVDGCSSASIITSFLREIGHDVVIYHPDRKAEGYGLNDGAINSLADEGVKLIIALDLGITAVEEVEFARERGVEVIIVDHHEPPEKLPGAFCIVDPHLDGDPTSPYAHLCTAGLAFYLVAGMRLAMREKGMFSGSVPEPDLKNYMDLVALGTIADMAALKGDNRILTQYGLKALSSTTRAGLVALKKISGIKNDHIGVREVGFELAPRLNASGRMDSASYATELLLTGDAGEARKLAEKLNGLNRRRQALEAEALEQALKIVEEKGYGQKNTIVVANEGWHPGVVGIVASRILDKYYRPTVVISITDGVGKGSARGISGFDVYSTLKASSDCLVAFGGHKMAGGLTVEADNVDEFRDIFEQHASEALAGRELKRTLKVDALAEPDELTMDCIEFLQKMGPHGIGNPEPVLVTKAVEILNPRVVSGKHLKFRIKGAQAFINAIAFGFGDHFRKLEGWADIAYNPGLDYWGGNKAISLKVKDMAPL